MEIFLQDLRYAVRMLLKKPGFAVVIVITLALGIGANTAIFCVVNGVLLQPLPLKDADRLVAVQESNPRVFKEPVGTSFPNFKDWKERNESFEQVAAFRGQSLTLTGEGEPVRLNSQSVSADFFPMLKVDPALGRTFVADDEKSRGKLAVLSYGLWQRRFGGDPAILERTLTLDGSSYSIVGVMPAGFRFLKDADLWTPLEVPAPLQQMRGARFLQVVARLKPNTPLAQARTAMTVLAQQLESEYSQSNSGWGVSVRSLQDKLVGDARQSLLVLLAAASIVLLIACVNVANLLLTRGTARQKEIAVRVALGANRWRLTRQLLTESTLLALVGGALGLLLALWGIDLLRALSPANLPRIDEIGIDKTVLAFTLIVSVMTGFVFGLAPVRQAMRVDLQKTLKESGQPSLGPRRLLRGALVVTEIALSMVLLVGAGLMSRSLFALLKVDPGFKAENLMSMDLSLPQYKYREEPRQQAFFEQLLERAEALPGVRSAALTTVLPLSGDESKNTFAVEGREASDKDWANLRLISPSYFETFGIPLLKGRVFEKRDAHGGPSVVIINDMVARTYWPEEDPVGKKIFFGDGASTVVGVVGNIRHAGLDREAEPEMYIPFSQQPTFRMVVVARVDSDPVALAGPLRDLVHSIDKDQPVENLRTMEQVVSLSLSQRRFLVILLSTFGALALVLAAVGVYGVMAFTVTQRTQEMGIRLALGAEASDIFKLVVGRAVALAVTGISIGLAGSLAITKVIAGLLFGVSPTDPFTLAAVSAVLMGVALMASLVPARRAMKVDPMVALRYE